MDDTDIDTKFERGDIVVQKSDDERVDDNLPTPDEFEIITVLVPKSYPEGQIKYGMPVGRPVCRGKIDRNYEMKEECSKD